ncbi:hypothetical protein [Helicobacter macacae]|nr:hypothetical protein [Helicobacter macacae]
MGIDFGNILPKICFHKNSQINLTKKQNHKRHNVGNDKTNDKGRNF